MAVVIKAYLEGADTDVEVRRIPVSLTSPDSNAGIFNETVARVRSAFPALTDKIFALKWKDADGDLIMMSSDEEMTEAISQSQNAPLKVYIAVEGVKVTEPEKAEPTQANGSQDSKPSENKPSNHEREDPFGTGWPFMGPMGMPAGMPTGIPFPPPSDCSFDPMNFYNTSQRGHSDCHNPRGHFGFQFGQQNPRGHNFDNLGPRGHHFGSMGPRGQHFMPTGPRGQHFGPMGPRGQSFGPMGRGGHFPGPFGQGPQFDHRGGHGHHFGPHGFPGHRGGHHFGQFIGMDGPFESHHFFEDQSPCPFACHEEKHEESNWKAKLRDAVPVAHRRWAKLYIRNWRVQNLKNATSTSSDSEQEPFTMEAASVPEAYTAWLDIFLPKWHKRQAKLDVDLSKDTESDPEERKKLKASVPLEFRKWAKWYLARHFGKKEAPRFSKDASKEEKMDKLHKKGFKKAFKMYTLAAFVPAEHRVWAEKFIHDWRQEHNILEPGAGNVEVLLENEAAEKETGQGSGTISEYYAKWMQKFLARWHLWRGLIDAQKVDVVSGEKGEFKDNVPKNFRKWVKCFMYQKYGKGAEKNEANTLDKYQKWMQAFQQKWLAEHAKEGDADDLVLTSSDEEQHAGVSSGTTGSTMESSFKKLQVDNEQDGDKKNVHFNFSTKNEKSNLAMSDSDSSDIEANPQFQHWDGTWRWDSRSAPASTDGDQIPAHVLMKMQMKRMKEEFKQAKHALKTTMKAQKYEQL
ncbi:hypothetical protein BsWGS_27178 [Bradybaena similaris]